MVKEKETLNLQGMKKDALIKIIGSLKYSNKDLRDTLDSAESSIRNKDFQIVRLQSQINGMSTALKVRKLRMDYWKKAAIENLESKINLSATMDLDLQSNQNMGDSNDSSI